MVDDRADAGGTDTGQTGAGGGIGAGRAELSVRLLGAVRAFLGGREIALGPPLQRAVFTVLAVRRDQVVDRGELIDAVWGEALPGNPEGPVHTYVAGLRRALEPVRARRSPGRFLESHPSGYRLRLPDPAATDLSRFERLGGEGRAAVRSGQLAEAERLFTEALDLFHGSVLAGVPGPFADAQRDWLAGARQALAEDRAEVLLGRRRYGEAAAEAERLADAQPQRERPWALLMAALYRDGRQAEAPAAYDRARTTPPPSATTGRRWL